jgi:hypothetical protein
MRIVAKSVALKRVKANLEDWEKQIVQIEGSKLRSDWFLLDPRVIQNPRTSAFRFTR